MPASCPPDILCPSCHQGHLLLNAAPESGRRCEKCAVTFPQVNGYLDLLPDEYPRRNFAQKVMEWEPLIKRYESKGWRTGFLDTLVTGMSFDREYETITGALDLGGREHLLDLACGTGIYSRPFARELEGGCVVGLDLSRPMLSLASSLASADNIDNLMFIHGNALELPFLDNTFDRLNCCGALHLFPNLPKALREIKRVVKDSGRITIAAYRNWMPWKFSDKLVDWHYRNIGVNYFRADSLGASLADAGLRNIEFLHDKRYWLIVSAMS